MKGLIISMNNILKYRGILLTILLVTVSLLCDAQPPPPGGTGPSCWPPPCIPIDGGIGFLVAAGVAYGAKKSWDFSKPKQNE